MTWKDNFSKQADIYAKYRPQYPLELYTFLVNLVKNHQFTWDCGTGNGQVATKLAPFFDNVIATDASQSQLAHAKQLPNIEYRVAKAEISGLFSNSVDLITVAQAIHWFDFDNFFAEVHRVARNDSMIAVWGYGLLKISPELDAVLQFLYADVLGDYWDIERKHLDVAYQTIPFPFKTIETPQFNMRLQWNLTQLIGYLKTWSSVQKFIAAKDYNPLK
ncbi:class I SAM-dependent methyltransferase, partial [Candidatus Parabeggiatoa sp. HSG14]|uniref:class I SAM-dependent methyltransferase n=1 Tax=Candidatus Parabeggiatoa sp. HSG14 TaxID=3055593 RepID=UPI0025A6D576|nr:class I SAM-dependent methyltransferase [Thiotrichales bacterium HSG14]